MAVAARRGPGWPCTPFRCPGAEKTGWDEKVVRLSRTQRVRVPCMKRALYELRNKIESIGASRLLRIWDIRKILAAMAEKVSIWRASWNVLMGGRLRTSAK